MFSDHRVKVEIKSRKTIGKSPNSWKLENILLNNPWIKEKVSMEIEKSTMSKMRMKMQYIKIYKI